MIEKVPDELHWMIDIETLSLDSQRARLLSIGIVTFDPDAEPGTDIEVVLHKRFPDSTGLVELSTVRFWVEQGLVAFDRVLELDEFTPEELNGFGDFVRSCNPRAFWANGVGFDLANLWAQLQLEETSGRSQYAWRDLRSVLQVLPSETREALRRFMYDENPHPHDALSDAYRQAIVVQHLYTLFRDLKWEPPAA